MTHEDKAPEVVCVHSGGVDRSKLVVRSHSFRPRDLVSMLTDFGAHTASLSALSRCMEWVLNSLWAALGSRSYPAQQGAV